VDFTAFVLSQLPSAPARVLEVGCGEAGGVTPALAEAGYAIVGIDPDAPEGPLFRRTTLEELPEDTAYDGVVCGRVLHHVRPLAAALDKLARLAPLLLVDEFASERLDARAQAWYEEQHRLLSEGGRDPGGPSDLDEWRARHPDLHPSHVLLRELRARYDELVFEERPYLSRWLREPALEAVEERLVGAGAIDAIGFRWAGRRRGCIRADGPSGWRA
jgi:Methyltransferase domain